MYIERQLEKKFIAINEEYGRLSQVIGFIHDSSVMFQAPDAE